MLENLTQFVRRQRPFPLVGHYAMFVAAVLTAVLRVPDYVQTLLGSGLATSPLQRLLLLAALAAAGLAAPRYLWDIFCHVPQIRERRQQSQGDLLSTLRLAYICSTPLAAVAAFLLTQSAVDAILLTGEYLLLGAVFSFLMSMVVADTGRDRRRRPVPEGGDQ